MVAYLQRGTGGDYAGEVGDIREQDSRLVVVPGLHWLVVLQLVGDSPEILNRYSILTNS